MSDLDGVCFVRRGNTLVPADMHADEFLSSLKDGREVIVTARKARNPLHHRWFFALLRKVVENTDDWQSEDELLDAVKLATGHVERRVTLDGGAYLAPKSISFAAMAQDKFKAFADRAVYLLATRVLGCSPDDLMAEVEQTQRRSAA